MREFQKIFIIWAILAVCGCQFPQPVLPELTSKKSNSHKSTSEQWRESLLLTTRLYNSGRTSLDKASNKIYSLVDPYRKSLIIPLIEEPSLQREIITQALKKGVFTDRELNKRQSRQIKNAWQQLIEAERDFLHAQRIIAKLRRKWSWWLFFPDLPNCDYFPKLALLLQESPSVYQLEILRDKGEILRRVCRSLLANSPSISLFTEFAKTNTE